MDWFLYDRHRHHEKVKEYLFSTESQKSIVRKRAHLF